ncbi:unnamed protein product [Prorocentrum cordatum]|uniref:Subtilisin n=1 Tax=Prorocentrum cordatum TaxID=2364126 RepID=A0ABN9V1W8_9DINO|nr:unnamed protein product [Polarella glacialis]
MDVAVLEAALASRGEAASSPPLRAGAAPFVPQGFAEAAEESDGLGEQAAAVLAALDVVAVENMLELNEMLAFGTEEFDEEPVQGFEINDGMPMAMQRVGCFTVGFEGKQQDLDGIADPTFMKAVADDGELQFGGGAAAPLAPGLALGASLHSASLDGGADPLRGGGASLPGGGVGPLGEAPPKGAHCTLAGCGAAAPLAPGLALGASLDGGVDPLRGESLPGGGVGPLGEAPPRGAYTALVVQEEIVNPTGRGHRETGRRRGAVRGARGAGSRRTSRARTSSSRGSRSARRWRSGRARSSSTMRP